MIKPNPSVILVLIDQRFGRSLENIVANSTSGEMLGRGIRACEITGL
ncbi:MAG: hypothetical protein P4M00_05760 [Azospirillaceae bacterium]|nr:hypothetical protein [Azospirillaceae bacterium]